MIDFEWLQRLIEWQRAKESRTLKIEFNHTLPEYVFAYDTALLDGMFVNYPDMPDIEGKKATDEQNLYEELRAKYGER